ncbi:MAG TPA: DUF2088 domain-containing protein [Firmicutes bacterium]|nr:DUF2088 domain-containing protein [Bacillota bacterium]
MTNVRIPWGHWYENGLHELAFPDSWKVTVAKMDDAPSIGNDEIERQLGEPIGTPPLELLAKGKNSAAIVVDDISRPTRGAEILPLIIKKLETAGINRDKVVIILALGSHRPMTRQDILKKVGPEILETVEVLNHHPFYDLVDVGISRCGNPIRINRTFMARELKIVVGTILPHDWAGFGGGAKNIIPGIGGIETLEANHRAIVPIDGREKIITSYLGNPENPLREDMEDIARKVGLDFIVNVVVNSKLEIAGLFAGDVVEAHREGVKLARRVFKTKTPLNVSVAVCNAYPKDTELQQVGNALNPLGDVDIPVVSEDGTVVLTTASSEGVGFHSLAGPGMKLFVPFDISFGQKLKGRRWMLYSPNLSLADVRRYYHGPVTNFYNDWGKLIDVLKDIHGNYANVVVFPQGPMQLVSLEPPGGSGGGSEARQRYSTVAQPQAE